MTDGQRFDRFYRYADLTAILEGLAARRRALSASRSSGPAASASAARARAVAGPSMIRPATADAATVYGEAR